MQRQRDEKGGGTCPLSSPLPCRALAGTAPQTISGRLAVSTGQSLARAAPPGLPSRWSVGHPGCCWGRPPFSASWAGLLVSVPGRWRGQLCRTTSRHPKQGFLEGARGPAHQSGSCAAWAAHCGLEAPWEPRSSGHQQGSLGLFQPDHWGTRQLPKASSFLPHPCRAQPATEDSPGPLRWKSQAGSGTGDLGRWVGGVSSSPSPQAGNCLGPSVGLRSGWGRQRARW